MTWYVDPLNGDVYDHEGALCANLVDDYGWDRSWRGEFPRLVLSAIYDCLDDSQSRYNQRALADATCEQVEMGTPP